MALGLKEAEKKLADFVSGSELHDFFSVTTCGGAEARFSLASAVVWLV